VKLWFYTSILTNRECVFGRIVYLHRWHPEFRLCDFSALIIVASLYTLLASKFQRFSGSFWTVSATVFRHSSTSLRVSASDCLLRFRFDGPLYFSIQVIWRRPIAKNNRCKINVSEILKPPMKKRCKFSAFRYTSVQFSCFRFCLAPNRMEYFAWASYVFRVVIVYRHFRYLWYCRYFWNSARTDFVEDILLIKSVKPITHHCFVVDSF